jgi:hypothetical protein
VTAGPGELIAVTVDGEASGIAPIDIDSLAPGPHDVRFSGPGMDSWGQTVEIKVHETRQILARAVQSPATGVLVVRAISQDEAGSQAVNGVPVYIDGVMRGPTPLQLELPRGPHSIRASYRGETAPIQVIDLPGGNQRFADITFGSSFDAPRLSVTAPARIPNAVPALISVTVEGAVTSDVREMWLHVRTPEGSWRRYAMNLMRQAGSVVGAVVFPVAMFDAKGNAPYYASALTGQGDEYFTEIKTAQGEPKR